jgi:hypoxanthine phosphoribosyltransferase
VLISRRQIAERVEALAEQIDACYDGTGFIILTVLTGSIVFLSDLIRHLRGPLEIAVTAVRSYPGPATRSLGPETILPAGTDLAGRHVLILDDILDSGQTLALLKQTVAAQRPASSRACVLLRKDRPDLTDRSAADFVGFDVPDQFVIGYGLDHNGLYRNLPDVCVFDESPPGGAP